MNAPNPSTLFLALAAAALIPSPVVGQCPRTEDRKLYAPDPGAGQNFGAPIAVDGSRFAITAAGDLATGQPGSVLVLQFDAGLAPALACPDHADADASSTVNAIDAAVILQFQIGFVETLPPQ